MEDESKYGHIQFEYVYKGDEFGGRPRKVVFSIPTPDMSMDELVEEFEYFLKAVGYHFTEGQHIGYQYDEPMDLKELDIQKEWEERHFPVPEDVEMRMKSAEDLKMRVESAGEVTTWDNAFKKKAEQMGDTIAKEYYSNVLP